MDSSINDRIAARVRQLRADRSMTLEALAERCGVSRSAISLIERGETSPTAVVLEKLAVGLGVTLGALFAAPADPGNPMSRRAEQVVWRDPASGYVRRSVSPAGVDTPIQIVEVVFPPGAHVAYETGTRETRTHQQVWMLDGVVEMSVGMDVFTLKAGDCLALVLDQPVAFRNRTRTSARYAVIVVPENRIAR